MEESQKDKLEWSEKAPLVLALAAQSYVLFNWYLATVDGIGYYADFVVAIAAGIALDLIVVTTTMGRREGRESKWSHAAAFGAFFCSALIALKVYGAASWLPEGWLHIAFPLEVWLYSQHLATPKRSREQSRQPATESPQPVALPIAPPAPTSLPLPQSDSESVAPLTVTSDNVLPDWLMDAARDMAAPQEEPDTSTLPLSKRVAAILNNRPALSDSELYELLPGSNQKSIRVYSSAWRKEHLATSHNGNGHHR